MILDVPIETGAYRPKNFNESYQGEVPLETALAFSLNTAAVRLMKSVGPRSVVQTARKLGIYSKLNSDLSLALGSSGLSLLELSTAYATLSNGGLAVYPYAITKITNEDGDLYYQRPRRRSTRRVVERKHVRTLTRMMEHVVEDGTGRRARLGGTVSAAGKTGTSQDHRDAWFVGFTDEMVAGVWLGNDNNTPMDGVTGGSYPAEIWRDVMRESHGPHKFFRPMALEENGFSDLLGRLIPSRSSYNQ